MEERVDKIMIAIGKELHVRFDDVAREALPSRWVELIHYLNERERSTPSSDHSRERKGPGDQGG